jgi:hypothetical protein
MYKIRINTWRLDKNHKEHEMAAVLRKHGQRDTVGKQSSFRVRQRLVSIEEVHRYFRRKGIPLEIMLTRYARASTPPDVSCSTPPLTPRSDLEIPRPPATPQALIVPEQLFFYINEYMGTSFGNKSWIVNENGLCINTITLKGGPGDLNKFYDYYRTSVGLIQRQLFVEARKTLSKACSLVQSILLGEDPLTIDCLLDIFTYFIKMRVPEIVRLLIEYISGIARIVLIHGHPWGQICTLLKGLETEHLEDAIIQSWDCMIQACVQCLGQHSEVALSLQKGFIEKTLSGKENLPIAEQRLRKLQLECHDSTSHLGNPLWAHGRPDWRTGGPGEAPSFLILLALANNLYDQGEYGESESVASDLIDAARGIEYYRFQVQGLAVAARAQYKQGKTALAEMNVKEAVTLISNHWEGSDAFALVWVVRLETLLQKWEGRQEAAKLRNKREFMMQLGIDGDGRVPK